MDILVERAPIEQKSVLRNLLELYIYDFTEFGPYDVDEHGLYGYNHLDCYWNEEGRHPFIVKVDGKIAGFVLVEHKVEDNYYYMSEFFIMKRYRGKNIGKEVAFQIFNLFPGVWEIAEMKTNIPAQVFWRKIINQYTTGNFEEIVKAKWNGPIQRFISGQN